MSEISEIQDDILTLIKDDKARIALAIMLRNDFRSYIEVMFPFGFSAQFKFQPFHEQIIKALQELVEGKASKPNLMLNLPVGSGKSVLIELFITWCFARNKNCTFCYTSHARRLIEKLSKETRDIVSSEVYEALFGIRLKNDDRSKINYSFEDADARTGLTAGAMGSGLTGVDAGNPNLKDFSGALIIDDPLDAEAARSEAERDTCIDIYANKLKTRIRASEYWQPPIIVIAQRLDVEDLCGYIDRYESSTFDIIKVKALDDNDVSFWEDRKPAKMLKALRDEAPNPAIFYAQYQQEPINLGGQVFRTEWFQSYYLKEQNDILFDKTFIVADTAMKIRENNDFSVFTVWGMVKDMNNGTRLYMLDGIKGKWEAPDLLTQGNFIYSKWRCRFRNRRLSGMYIEDKVSGTGLLQTMRRQNIPVLPIKRTQKDKLTRVEDILSWIASGQVYLPIDHPFTQELKNEAQLFARDMSHKHDDVVDTLVDACSIAFTGASSSIFDIMFYMCYTY